MKGIFAIILLIIVSNGLANQNEANCIVDLKNVKSNLKGLNT